MLNLPFKFYIGEDQRFLLEVVLISVLAGIFLTLFLQYLFFKLRFGVLPVLSPPTKEQFPKIKLPKVLIEEATKSSLNITENCLWFNLLTQFLFRELRDTQRIRRWVMKKMNKEFQELLSTLSGKIMDQIIVRHFNLGNNFPVFKSVSIKNVIIHEDVIEELDLCLDVNYTGGFQLAVDVFLLFNKSAYLSVTMNKLMGKARMQFSRMPFTHWSFSFYEDPEIDFAVESHFDGRPVPQIATLIISQIRRSIRKKHTLPNFKMRFQPFFSKPEPYVPQRELKVAGQSISVGQLRVTVVECSRLPRTPKEALLYCNVSIDTLPWNELIGIQQRIWKTLEIEVTKEQGQNVGLTFKEEHLLDRLEVVVLVDSVTPGTPAVLADIRKNDILLAVGTTKVSSSKHAAKLIRNAGEKFTLRIDRADSKHYKYYEDTISSKDSVMMSEMGDETQSEYADDEFVNISIKGGDQMSLRSATASETKSVKLPDSYMRMPRAAADDSDGESSNHISLRKKGRSESVPCLTIPEEIQIESEYVSDSDEDLFNNVQRIPEVQASQRPCWNKQVVFDVTEQYRYLNVCVRCKVPEKVDKSDRVVKHQRDLLLGHASLPLSDIALQCLLTRQGDSRQTMPLQQGEIKISASHVKSRRPAQMQQLYYGDITLAYHFQPVNMSEKERLKLTRDVIHNTIYETSSRDSSPDNRFSEKAQM